MKLLTVMIPTLNDRKQFFDNLIEQLSGQVTKEIEIAVLSDNRELTTGEKRNLLIDQCETEWCVFIDDDDQIAHNYIERHVEILKAKPETDAIGFLGMIWTDGKRPHQFEHKHNNEYKEDNSTGVVRYIRPIMHINVIRTSIARQIRYPDLTFAEDMDYGLRLQKSGLIQKAEFINEVMYHYLYRSNK